MAVGENLTSYPNVEVLSARDEQELKRQLLQINLPHKIISIYGMGNRHYAWVSLTNPIKKKVIRRKSIKKLKE
jgi:hypothetical protein